jgi:hypothetical protein
MGTKMKQALCAVGMTMFLLSASLWGQQWIDWAGADNNYTILYRYRMLNSGKTCDVEFKDENQGDRPTTFDAAVDYQTTPDSNSTAPASPYSSTAPPPNNNNKAPTNTRVKKTTSVHVVTTKDHNGEGQIANCFAINEVRVSFVQRP